MRLKNVTEDDILLITVKAGDLAQAAADARRRAEQGYLDGLKMPIRHASVLLRASRNLADLAQAILVKAELAEAKVELEKELGERYAQQRE